MVVVDGGTTNQGFLLELLDRPEVRARRGRHRLARPAATRRRGRAGAPRRRRAAAGRDRARRRARRPLERARFYAFARRGRPQADAELAPHGRAAPPRPGLPLRASRRSRRGRYRVEVDGVADRGRGRAPRPRTSAGSSCGGDALPHADLRPGRRPARRGRRRPAPHRRATTAASSAASRPRSSSSIPVAPGDEVRARRRRGGRRER